MEQKYYTVKEFSELVRISERQIRLLCESGKLKCCKLGNLWRIHKSSLEGVKV